MPRWLIVSKLLYPNRLVLDADNIPVVLPFVHTGMQEIMPIGAKFPRVGKTVCSCKPFSIVIYIENRKKNGTKKKKRFTTSRFSV